MNKEKEERCRRDYGVPENYNNLVEVQEWRKRLAYAMEEESIYVDLTHRNAEFIRITVNFFVNAMEGVFGYTTVWDYMMCYLQVPVKRMDYLYHMLTNSLWLKQILRSRPITQEWLYEFIAVSYISIMDYKLFPL